MLSLLRDLPVFATRDLTKSVSLAMLEGICLGLPYGLFIHLVQQLVNGNPDASTILMTTLAIATILLFRAFITRMSIVHTGTITYTTCAALRESLAGHFFKVPLGFFEQHDSGRLSQSMNKDVEFTESIFSHHFAQVIASISLLVTVAVCLLIYDWRLAVSLLAGVPIAVLLQVTMRHQANRVSQNLLQQIATNNRSIMDWILGIRDIKQSGNGAALFPKLQATIEKTRQTSLRHEIRVGLVPVLFILFSEAGFLVFLLVGLDLYFSQHVELSVFLVFLIASVRIYRSLTQVALTMAESRFMQQAAKRITALLDSDPIQTDEQDIAIQGTVSVRHLSFRYPGRAQPVLEQINFEARPGTLTAIVGPSGSGKSTLLHLLARFWQVERDQIQYDGHSIHAFSDAALYRQVALVSQDIHLLDDTVFNNLSLVRPELTKDEIYRACHMAQCHDFICQLPQGYDTQIGEAGGAISGGEKQRIALARAILSDARVILLDEISAALDVRNEAALLNLLAELKQDKTLISISHRESMVTHADQVIYLVHGQQEGAATHQQLLAQRPDYRQFWHHQLTEPAPVREPCRE
ncbi:ABC transporter ATP-binding protein [Photobacterium sp. MCCC 1A19761]|uniref:ABC transporter ATP-binding protein n=1 Tax=Photobacterium sp. MCCC 1A19761 TaxID=3115000 RepID=UPI00307F565F